MHVHIWETERAFPMFIANGVTGVRNTGGHLDELKRWREQVASGTLLGPRMVICGLVIDGPNPSHPGHSIVVHNAGEGREAVDVLKTNGANFVKVYDGVPRDAYFAIADEQRAELLGNVGAHGRSVNFLNDCLAPINDGQKVLQIVAVGVVAPSATPKASSFVAMKYGAVTTRMRSPASSSVSCAASIAGPYHRLVKPSIFPSIRSRDAPNELSAEDWQKKIAR